MRERHVRTRVDLLDRLDDGRLLHARAHQVDDPHVLTRAVGVPALLLVDHHRPAGQPGQHSCHLLVLVGGYAHPHGTRIAVGDLVDQVLDDDVEEDAGQHRRFPRDRESGDDEDHEVDRQDHLTDRETGPARQDRREHLGPVERATLAQRQPDARADHRPATDQGQPRLAREGVHVVQHHRGDRQRGDSDSRADGVAPTDEEPREHDERDVAERDERAHREVHVLRHDDRDTDHTAVEEVVRHEEALEPDREHERAEHDRCDPVHLGCHGVSPQPLALLGDVWMARACGHGSPFGRAQSRVLGDGPGLRLKSSG